MSTIDFDREKFKELLLYVAQKCAAHRSFGATKLNKILFFSDFFAYGLFGRPITGATYQRLEHGPAPRQFLNVVGELRKLEEAAIERRGSGPFAQKRLVALRDPDLERFSAKEIALVDDMIEQLRHRTALEVSRASHDQALGWQFAEDGEDIPYSTVFLSCEPPSVDDIKRGQGLAAEHGWNA